VGKIAEKAVCGSVLLTIWHCILSAKLTKNALLQAVLPTALCLFNYYLIFLLFWVKIFCVKMGYLFKAFPS